MRKKTLTLALHVAERSLMEIHAYGYEAMHPVFPYVIDSYSTSDANSEFTCLASEMPCWRATVTVPAEHLKQSSDSTMALVRVWNRS